MAYHIKYKTKRGGGMVKTFSTNLQAQNEVKRLFKARTQARCEKDSFIIGEVYKSDLGRWQWYFDTEA